MRDARDHFNGDIVVPLPEMDADERPAVANLMAQGVDQTSMRVASVLPNMHFPPLIPGKDKDQGSEDWARRRHMAVTGWWQESRLNLELRRLARWIVGYSTGPMMIRPDFKTRVPRYELRDPLGTYPSDQDHTTSRQPVDVIYSYVKTFSTIQSEHPEAAEELVRWWTREPSGSTMVDLLEYIGPEWRMMGFIGMQPGEGSSIWSPRNVSDWGVGTHGVQLMRVPNRTGVSWGVQSDRITIDRLQGQFDQVFGTYRNQAELMALETIAVKKAIFPDLVIQGTTPGRTPLLVNGNWKDGRTGDINIVRDGSVQALQLNPGFMTQPLIDRHERMIRNAGVPAQFSGETPTNIATGRLGDQTLSATVDFPIQEYQEILASTLEEGNKVAIAIAKEYFGDEQKKFYVSFHKANGYADYKPETHFETDAHFVRYAQPGADVNSLVIGLGQRIGLGTMPKELAAQQDPMIPDPVTALRKVTSERIQESLLEYVAQQVVAGALDPMDVVLLWEEVERGTNLADAWRKAQEAAQQRQAEQQQAAQQQQVPGDPSLQPGLSPGEAGQAIGPPTPSQQNLASMLNSLRQPSSVGGPMASGATTPSAQAV